MKLIYTCLFHADAKVNTLILFLNSDAVFFKSSVLSCALISWTVNIKMVHVTENCHSPSCPWRLPQAKHPVLKPLCDTREEFYIEKNEHKAFIHITHKN